MIDRVLPQTFSLSPGSLDEIRHKGLACSACESKAIKFNQNTPNIYNADGANSHFHDVFRTLLGITILEPDINDSCLKEV